MGEAAAPVTLGVQRQDILAQRYLVVETPVAQAGL